MTPAQLTALRNFTPYAGGSYRLIFIKTGQVAMFGLTEERAKRYVESHPSLYRIEEPRPL